MENSVIAIHQSCVITTIIVYALLVPVFFEMDNTAHGEGENFVENDKTMYSQQVVEEVETECKSPCSSSAELCIAMCA